MRAGSLCQSADAKDVTARLQPRWHSQPGVNSFDMVTNLSRTTKDRVLLLLMGLLFVGAGLGLRDPWPSDEPRFALVAKEMVESGHWFFPTRGGELYPDKPPIFMWSQAIFYKLTGSLKIAALLPSLLAGLLTLMIVYEAGRMLWSRRVGRMAGLLLLAAPQFVLESRAGQLDAMVMCWIAGGVYCFLRYLLVNADVRWLLAGFAACGFGVITKGVGFLPLLLFIPAILARRSGHHPSPAKVGLRRGAGGVAVLLLAVATWLVPMLVLVHLSNDPAYEAYRDNILFKQTGERYLDSWHHFKPPWYFVVEVIPSLWLPIFLLFPWLIPAWWRRIRRGDARLTLLLGWVVLVIAFFSMSSGKRGVYILPALPWICLAAAPALAALLRRRGVQRSATLLIGLIVGICAAAVGYLHWIRPDTLGKIVQKYEVDPTMGIVLIGLGALIGLIVAASGRAGRGFLTAMGGLWLVYGLWVYPTLDGLKSGRALLLKVEEVLPPDRPLALVDWREQTLLQAQREAQVFGFLVPVEDQMESALDWLEIHPDGAILTEEAVARQCFDPESWEDLGLAHRTHWVLVGRSSLELKCEP